MVPRICIQQWGTSCNFQSGVSHKLVKFMSDMWPRCQSSLCCVIVQSWNSRTLPNSCLILMRVLWVVIKSSLATCSVNSSFSSEQSLGLCADPGKLTWRFIQLFSKGPHLRAYSQKGELVFQWISLSIWMQSGWDMVPATGRPWVMYSFVFCHLEDQTLEAVQTFRAARKTTSFSSHRWWILWVYPPFTEDLLFQQAPAYSKCESVIQHYISCKSTQDALITKHSFLC